MKWLSLLVFVPFVLVSGRLASTPANLAGSRLASAADIRTWHKVAVASGDSAAYAEADFKATQRSYGSRLRVRATSRAKVSGDVDCTRGLDNENRTFSFRLGHGGKRIPTPLIGGQCSYWVSAVLPRGGRVKISLYVVR